MDDKYRFDDFDRRQFELDFCTVCNMMLGMRYDEAVNQAIEDVREAREADEEYVG